MMSETANSAERFFDAAMSILASEGYAGLKLAPVCAHLGMTTGSFYHHFASWKDFTDQLLQHWHVGHTTRLIRVVEAESDPIQRLKILQETAMSLPHRSEAAIRIWSGIDPAVHAVQAAVDKERYDIVYSTFVRLVPEEEAERLSRTALFLVAGHNLIGGEHADETLAWSLRLLIDTAIAVH